MSDWDSLGEDAEDSDELTKIKGERDRLARQLYETKHKHADYLAAVENAVTEAVGRIELAPVRRSTTRTFTDGQEEYAVALLSDLQTGKLTPDYNSGVAADRVMRYAQKIVSLADIQRLHHPVRHCVVPMLGDMVEGVDIFPGQQWLIDSTLYDQLFNTTPALLADFVRYLLAHFETVTVYAVDGNHGRIGRRGQFGPMDNSDRMLYRILAMLLRDEPRFKLTMTDPQGERNWYQVMELGNYSALLIHGDQIRGHSGFPWYGLCSPSEAEILTRSGWKTHGSLAVGEEVLTFDHVTHENRWEPLQSVNVFDWAGDLYEVNGIPVTPGHRWPVEDAYNGKRFMRTTQEINTNHKVPLHGEYRGEDSILSPRLAAILGWIVTDGTARWIGNHWEAGIYQSAKPRYFLSEIERLTGMERRKSYANDVHYVPVSLADRQAIAKVYQGKADLPALVPMLSRESADAMADAMYKAEGNLTGKQRRFSQVPGPVAEAYTILSVLTGSTVSVASAEESILRMTHRKSRYVYPARDGGMARIPYEGIVWCPTTPSGTWWLRYRGQIMPTGNSKKVNGWGSGGIGETFQDVFMGHWHQLARIPLNSRSVWVNGSTESTNTYASENLAAQSEPSQWLLFVDPTAGRVTASYGVDLREGS